MKQRQMDKKRLFQILARADAVEVSGLVEPVLKGHEVTIIKEPQKTLAMIQLREPVQGGLFYIGELIACEAVVMVDEVRGMAVTMGDNFDKVLHMAVIDAACNKGIFTGESRLMELEREQVVRLEKENAMHLETMVQFHSMDGGMDADVCSGVNAAAGREETP